MSQQPRRNEARFYRYPMRRIVAIIDDDVGVQAALDALQQAGIDVTKINVLTGPEGARLLDRTGARRGLGARLLRLAQMGAYEGDALESHERALNEGKSVIYVPVRGKDQRSRVVDILRSAGGYYLLHFRPWSIEVLTP
jgi:hypothetical protein